MTTDGRSDDADLDGNLQRALRSQPPGDLTSGVRARLIVARAARRRTRRRVALATALTGVVVVGALLMRPTAPRPTHMLIIQEQLADRLSAPSAERARRGREFGVWVQGLRDHGLLLGGQQLRADGGLMVSAAGIEDRSAGVPPGEVVSGFLLIQASDERRAIRAAEACPILAYGGRVLVRRISQ